MVWTACYHLSRSLSWDPDQHHRPVDTDQSLHQLSHSHLSLGPQVSPPSIHPSRPLCFQQPLQAFLPPSPHQLQPFPVARAPRSMTPGVTESERSEVILPTANPGISQKIPALRLKPCGHAEAYPHDPQGAEGDRDTTPF